MDASTYHGKYVDCNSHAERLVVNALVQQCDIVMYRLQNICMVQMMQLFETIQGLIDKFYLQSKH